MLENIWKLYSLYGGLKAILSSSYFWLSVGLALLSYDAIANFEWTKITLSVIPSLTGFTIASFALIFAILEPHMLQKLTAADDNGKSPIAEIAASIGHAVFIQVCAITIAASSELINLTRIITSLDATLNCLNINNEFMYRTIYVISLIFSSVGLILTYYGISLVLAAILSIFRMQLIVAGASKSTPSNKGNKSSNTLSPPS